MHAIQAPKCLYLFLFLFATSTSISAEQADAFLARYCIDCHSSDDPNGEREFTSLDLKASDFDTQIRLQEVIDQLTLGAMPPEDGEQPPQKDKLKAIERFRNTLAEMRAKNSSTGGQTVLRRLSRREYRNTVGDLLGIDMTTFDPTQEFPADNLVEGFDNVGAALVTSGFLLEKYLDAADAVIEKALPAQGTNNAFASTETTQPQEWTFKDYFYQQPELRIAHDKAFKHKYLILYDHPLNDKPEGAYGPLHDMKEGVPADGIYEVRVLAQALHRDTPYVPKAVFMDVDEPFRMGIRPGDTRIGDMVHVQPIQPKVAEAVIADNELKWYTFQIPLDAGWAPRFTFENGQHDVRGSYGRVFRLHRDTLPEEVRDGKGIVAQRNAVIKLGQLPQIRIHEVQVKGPLPTESRQRTREILFGADKFLPENVAEQIARFASRAYRRPVTDAEVAELTSLYHARVEQSVSEIEAYKDTLKAVLCSPEFLYLNPPSNADSSTLSQHALAERLSYFLTSSMPDDELRACADTGTLNDSKVLRRQASRLLNDKSSKRFVVDFLDNWLNLRDLGSMPPDPQQFRVYYSSGLEPEMKQETQTFLRELINRNASVLEFLRADYSFANRDLAKLYGVENQIPIERASEFHRVMFKDPNRGGLLGQASVLTVSANGIETSPVVRGVWLMEKVLGTPPPAPPDDVPPIDPDVRGTTTIRDRLEKHRASATCNQCHRKIDPLGFALESFDPIGRPRNFYDRARKVPIDTSSVLPGGDTFDNVGELKQLLLKRKEFFVRNVTTRLLNHALGRQLEASDRQAIDQIIHEVEDNDYATRDLILAIVCSDLFQQR